MRAASQATTNSRPRAVRPRLSPRLRGSGADVTPRLDVLRCTSVMLTTRSSGTEPTRETSASRALPPCTTIQAAWSPAARAARNSRMLRTTVTPAVASRSARSRRRLRRNVRALPPGERNGFVVTDQNAESMPPARMRGTSQCP